MNNSQIYMYRAYFFMGFLVGACTALAYAMLISIL